MLIDTHAHLSDDRLRGREEEIIGGLSEYGIEAFIEIGCDVSASRYAVDLAARRPEVYATVGIHPEYALDTTDEDIAEIARLAKSDKVVAIGEIGLDYHYDGYDKDAQKELLVKQIKLAYELGLPVVLHLRDAYRDMEEILLENRDYLANGVLLHCYSGSKEMLSRFAFLDPYYAFGGAITFKNNNRAEVIRAVKPDRLLIETDCPYLTPVPHRGEINLPWYVKHVAERMASDLEMDFDKLSALTTENAKRFYRIER